MLNLLIVWALNTAALLVVAYMLPGVSVDGTWAAVWAALILGLVNAVVRPILLVLTLPLTVLTLGLFLFVLNGLMFYWVGAMLDRFTVDGFWWAVLAAALYSLITTFFNAVIFPKKVRIERIN